MIAADVTMFRLAGHLHWERAPIHGLRRRTISLTLFLAVALREELAFRGLSAATSRCRIWSLASSVHNRGDLRAGASRRRLLVV